MSISSTESNRQPGIYAQYPQNGQFESNYVVHTSDTEEDPKNWTGILDCLMLA